jgi:hypothetical protein
MAVMLFQEGDAITLKRSGRVDEVRSIRLQPAFRDHFAMPQHHQAVQLKRLA